MATEFHNRDFSCAVDAIIPQGSSYQNSAFQGCAYRGVGSGQLSLNGDAYITQEFGFSFNNVGRDFGILFVFLAGLLLINMLLAEGIDWSARVHGGAEYARKSMDVVQSKLPDEENAKEIPNQAPVTNHTPSPAGAPRNLSTSASAFTWRDIDYYVPHMGQQKQLLHKVSGFCESGKLTALVGPSGAGKTTCKTSLPSSCSKY
jgi:ABC-type multidrug transport system fused ATPase/permease subunit